MTNHIDRAAVSISTTPAALAGLPASNLKVPWLDGIGRGASSAYDVSFSWEQRPANTVDLPWGDVTDLVAVLGLNWRTSWTATLKWWNAGGSWSLPLGSMTAYWYLTAFGNQWPVGIQRNLYLPLLGPTVARYWRLDVTLSDATQGAAYPWEARRLWSGPAIRFGQRKGMRVRYGGTQSAVDGETGIPAVTRGRTYRTLQFGGRALPRSDVHPALGFVAWPSLQMLLYDKGIDSEAIYLPQVFNVAASVANNGWVQSTALYGRLTELETSDINPLYTELSGAIKEVPVGLPSPLLAPA